MKSFFSHKGVAAVEMALILPLLLALTFGLIEFGLFMYNQQVLTNAAREGARAGIIQHDPRITAPEIQTAVEKYLGGPTYPRLITFNTTPALAFSPPPTACISLQWNTAEYVTVNLRLRTPYLVAYSLVQLLTLGTVELPEITLSTESVMKCE